MADMQARRVMRLHTHFRCQGALDDLPVSRQLRPPHLRRHFGRGHGDRIRKVGGGNHGATGRLLFAAAVVPGGATVNIHAIVLARVLIGLLDFLAEGSSRSQWVDDQDDTIEMCKLLLQLGQHLHLQGTDGVHRNNVDSGDIPGRELEEPRQCLGILPRFRHRERHPLSPTHV